MDAEEILRTSIELIIIIFDIKAIIRFYTKTKKKTQSIRLFFIIHHNNLD